LGLATSQPLRKAVLLVDLGHTTSTNGAATLTDSEAQALVHCDRLDQLDAHLNVVARHDHVGALWQGDDPGDVGGTEVELRTVVVEERGGTAALVLGQVVDGALELGLPGGTALLSADLGALAVPTALATQQQS